MENEKTRAIIAGINFTSVWEYSIEELKGLAEADEVEVLGVCTQSLEKPNSATYIGKGKTEELKELVSNMEANLVIFNNELSGVQIRNLEDRLEVKVIDRTILILDIFAKRAKTKNGQLQVELAQQKYRKSRLVGFGNYLSKQGAGIGTRGPGEKKIETDRRHLEKRIEDIQNEIDKAVQVRKTQRKLREKNRVPIVALVGYTNAGKSALMNALLKDIEKEDKVVFEKDMLFATLDTSQRSIKYDDNNEFILVDTIGFVSELPHTLVDAFKGTLEEVLYADLLIHVIDISNSRSEFQERVTLKVLNEIGAGDKEILNVYNKADLLQEEVPKTVLDDKLYISAKYGINIDLLKEKIGDQLFNNKIDVKLLIPYDRGDIVSYLCDKCNVEEMDYKEDGTIITTSLEIDDYRRLSKYEIV
ncbi:MAG: GTPase HflX [Peptostreptococcaceae bacterium]|nr:GTPase HflX [Peptostreptococcaceae bacterium]